MLGYHIHSLRWGMANLVFHSNSYPAIARSAESLRCTIILICTSCTFDPPYRDDISGAMDDGLRAEIVRIILDKMSNMCVGVSPLPIMYTY